MEEDVYDGRRDEVALRNCRGHSLRGPLALDNHNYMWPVFEQNPVKETATP